MILSSVLLSVWAAALGAAPGHVRAIKVNAAPVIDGRLDDAAWSQAEPFGGFLQQVPFDGSPPSEQTTVRVVYDADAVYFGISCQQRQTPILGHLIRRDADSESDAVFVYLDTRDQGRDAFWVAVNVAGSQADGTIHDQNIFSTEWDENWEAATSKDDHAWTAEFRVPFRVLRFASARPFQSWGIQVIRYIAARQEVDQLFHVPRDNVNWVANFGRLDGIEQVSGGTAIELRPYASMRLERNGPGALGSGSGYRARPSAGLDLRLHLSDSLTLDGAILPDFTQVEADPLVLNLTNFETFLPEKRALFVEGADIFATPMEDPLLFASTGVFPNRIFYSRRVGSAPPPPALRQDAMSSEVLVNSPTPSNIYAAAKLIQSAAQGWSVGALSALTARNDVTVQEVSSGTRSTRVVDPTSLVNVLRVKRSVGAHGQLGVTATGVTRFDGGDDTAPAPATFQLCPSGVSVPPGARCFRDAYVAALDGLWRSAGGEYLLGGQVVGSLIENGPPVTAPDGTVVGTGDRGGEVWLRAAREGGKNLQLLAEYTGTTTKLDYNDAGYMARANLQQVRGVIAYRTLEPGRYTLEGYAGLSALANWNAAATLDLGRSYSATVHLRFVNFWTATAIATSAATRFDDREIGDGAALERPASLALHLEMTTDPRRPVVLSAAADGTKSTAGVGTSAQAGLLLQPHPQIGVEIDPVFTHAAGEIRFAAGATAPGADYLFGRLRADSASVIVRATYLFTPRLSLQLYAQLFVAAGHYSDFQTFPRSAAGTPIRLSALVPTGAPATNPDFEQGALNANVVLRWEYRLGSIIYLVYSRSQSPQVTLDPGQPASLTTAAVLKSPAVDVVLLKANFWWSR